MPHSLSVCYIAACLPDESARTRVGKALVFLSHRCDHAHQRDKHGFNKYDSPHGKSWAAAFESGGVASLEPYEFRAAHRMLQKYHRQLAEGGIELPTNAQLEIELKSVMSGIHKQTSAIIEKQNCEIQRAGNTSSGFQTACIPEQSSVHSQNPAGSLCLTGSQLYHDHLKRHNKGCNEINIHEVLVMDAEDHLMTFRLAKKIPEVDAVSIRRINSDIVWNVDRDFSINEYDVDHNILLVTVPSEQVFETLVNSKTEDLRISLTKTFRFGTNLAAVLDEYVYKIGFSGAVNGTTELLFIDAPGEQPQPSHPSTRKASRENLAEAEAIKRWIKIEQPQDAIILAPYTAQVRLLGDMLPEYRRDQKILTVHGSQGREWDDVILSVVDTDRLWFTDSRNKRSRGLNLINTAVSRAKKRLVIVCNRSWWIERRGQLIRALLLAGEDAIPVLF